MGVCLKNSSQSLVNHADITNIKMGVILKNFLKRA